MGFRVDVLAFYAVLRPSTTATNLSIWPFLTEEIDSSHEDRDFDKDFVTLTVGLARHYNYSFVIGRQEKSGLSVRNLICE